MKLLSHSALTVLSFLTLSSSALALTASDFQVASDIRNQSISSEASLTEMSHTYHARVSEFKAMLTAPNLTVSQKKVRARNFLNYASVEIKSQTGGEGLTYNVLMMWHDSVKKQVNEGHLNDAANSAVDYAETVLGIL